MQAIWAAPTDGLLRDAVLFDIYRPKSGDITDVQEKSMAVRLTLNGLDVALTEAQIETTVAAVVATLATQLGARQRA
jgi:phenylalanyl-tRNA synthetase beta chain